MTPACSSHCVTRAVGSLALGRGLEHLRGQRSVRRVQLVAERRAHHRLPAVLARQGDDALEQQPELQPLAEPEVHAGDLDRVELASLRRLDDAERGVRGWQRGDRAWPARPGRRRA